VTDGRQTTKDWSHLGDPPDFPDGERRLIIIASYPRSGSNWIGRTLEHALLQGIGWLDPIARGRRGVYHDLDRFITDGRLDEIGRWASASSLILKTHRLPEFVERDAPGLLSRADLVVGVLRHPLDVMASVFRYLLWAGAVTHEGERVSIVDRADELGLAAPFVDAFVSAGGHAPFEALGFGAWASHAEAWSEAMNSERGARLKYRDLLRDARGQLTQAVDRLGLGVTPEQIGGALASASPDRISAQFGAGFVRSEKDVSFDALLSPEQHARAEQAFEESVARYALSRG